jgi:hypothetical protein
MKWCPDCGNFRAVAEFPRNRGTRDGLAAYCKPHQNARTYKSRQQLHGGSRHYHLVRRYGITAQQVNDMIEVQLGRCLICQRPLGDNPQVDHDHDSGDVRGILCFNCNGGLGQFGDDRERLSRAMDYLDGVLHGRSFYSPAGPGGAVNVTEIAKMRLLRLGFLRAG